MTDRQRYQTTVPNPDHRGWYTTHICHLTGCAGRDDPRHESSFAGILEIAVCPPPGRDVHELMKDDGPIRCPDCDELESCCVCSEQQCIERRGGICAECRRANGHYRRCSRDPILSHMHPPDDPCNDSCVPAATRVSPNGKVDLRGICILPDGTTATADRVVESKEYRREEDGTLTEVDSRMVQRPGYVAGQQPSITCPACGRTSYNPHDIANQYCGNCHRFATSNTLPPTPWHGVPKNPIADLADWLRKGDPPGSVRIIKLPKLIDREPD